jgi:putative MATE family efflux protein
MQPVMTDKITWRLEHEKPGRLLLSYALPAVVGTMINSLYYIVDRIYIGHGLGSLAISGLTITFPVMLFLQAFGMLIGAGASARVSIFLGKKENEQAEKVLGNALILKFIISFCVITLCMLFLKDLLIWFGGSENTIPCAMDYLNIIIPGNILTTLCFGFNSIMRASGYPKKAMYTMIIGAVMNIILDPIFIFVLDMGMQGAAIATVISMTISTIFVMYHFVSRKSLIRFRKKYFKLDWPIIRHIVSIGISPFSMQLGGSLVNIVLNNALYLYGGDLALGANGILISLAMLLVMFVIGLSQGMQPIVGFNFGAGNRHRVMETLRLVIIVATCVMGAGWICGVFFPEIIVKAFTTDQELIAITANGIRLNFMLLVVVGSQIVISHFFQSIGSAWKTILLSLSRQMIFLIPAIFILARYFGLNGIWIAGPVSDGLATITAWSFLLHYIKSSK